MDNFTHTFELEKQEIESKNRAIEANLESYEEWNWYGIVVSISMIFYAASKLIFNIFATIKLPMDIWSQIDIFCAFTNIFAFMMLYSMDVEDVIVTDKK